jgi:hypothetical protein
MDYIDTVIVLAIVDEMEWWMEFVSRRTGTRVILTVTQVSHLDIRV